MKNSTNKTLWEIFKVPLLIALVSILGLVSALLGDGILDAISWVLLAVPLYACRNVLRLKPKRLSATDK